MQKIVTSLGFLISLSASALGQTIGISLPLSGDFAELGAKFRKGVEIAAKEIGQEVSLIFVDDGCDPEMTEAATQSLIEQKSDIVTGFLCSDAAIVAATKLSDEKTPLLISGARSVRLIKDRERETWNLWRFSPGDDYPVQVAAKAIAERWRDIPFALVDDGTIYGRNFTDQLRFLLDERGLKPQFSDSFRAANSTQAGLLRRLQRSGITSALIASATLEDLQTIAIDNARLETNINIMATEALMALPFIETAAEVPAGIKVIGWPLRSIHPLDEKLAEESLLPNRLIHDGYAAFQIAFAALGTTHAETTKNLAEKDFQTILGNINFRKDGSSTFNPYQLLEWDGEQFLPLLKKTETQ